MKRSRFFIAIGQHKKLNAAIMIAIIAVSVTFGVFQRPQKVQAWPTENLELGSIFQPIWDFTKTEIFGTIKNTIKIRAIEFARQEIIAWVSGEKGTATFISDFEDFLIDSVDVATSLFLEDVMGDSYSQLCSGININLGLAFKSEFDHKYKMPECRLSTLIQNFGNTSNPFDLVSVSFDSEQNDYLYTARVYEVLNEKSSAEVLKKITKVVANQGQVAENPDGTLKSPGAQINAALSEGVASIFNVQVQSDDFKMIIQPLVGALVEGTFKRGINEFKKFKNQ